MQYYYYFSFNETTTNSIITSYKDSAVTFYL